MDRRWPWKKKSTDKAVLDKAAAELDSAASATTQSNQVIVYWYFKEGSIKFVLVTGGKKERINLVSSFCA